MQNFEAAVSGERWNNKMAEIHAWGRIRGYYSWIFKKWVGFCAIVSFVSVFAIVLIRCSCIVHRFDAPQGLLSLLRRFELRPRASPDEGRARIYKRLWALLWVSCYIFKYKMLLWRGFLYRRCGELVCYLSLWHYYIAVRTCLKQVCR